MQKDFFASAIYFVHAKPTSGGQNHLSEPLVHAKPTFGGRSPFPAIYRGRPSGVPNSSVRALGTGKGPLAYQTHPPRHLVQEKALWRTESNFCGLGLADIIAG